MRSWEALRRKLVDKFFRTMRRWEALLLKIVGKIRGYIWRFSLTFRQLFRAAVQVSGITITVLGATYSLALPILLSSSPKGLIVFRFPWPQLLLIVVSLSVPLILLSGVLVLRTADSETYARILLAGRPAKEVLFTISKRIDRTCRRTLRLSTWAENRLRELEEKHRPRSSEDHEPRKLPVERWRPWVDRPLRWISIVGFQMWSALRTETRSFQVQSDPTDVRFRNEIDCLVWWFRGFPRRQHARLLRIEAMKLLASRELGIPSRRLCDHLFQYSPAIHRDRLQKYVQNWEEILDFWSTKPEVGNKRLWNLATENLSFINNTRRRRRYQRQILKHRDLLTYVVQFASTHSTSGSLQTYADALRFVAMMGQRKLTGLQEEARNHEMESIQDRLSFVCRKQRAHPGYDLHTLLLRAVVCIKSKSKDPMLLEGAHRVLKDLNESRGAKPPEISEELLSSFRPLSYQLANLVATSRENISKLFQEVYKEWFDGVQGAHYIVSHGYSRTVLSVLRKILPALAGTVSTDEPRLFFVLPKKADTFDTRVMEYEFKLVQKLRPFRNFAAGSEKHLHGVLSDRDSVLVLLGAECFDDDHRMVHPRGFGPGLKALRKKLRRRNPKIPFLVCVVAESYKRHKDPKEPEDPTGSLTDDINFYGQHFDRIDLYPRGLIDLIVTDEGTLPLDWENSIGTRKSAT